MWVKRLTVEHFRAFRDRQDFDLNGSAIVAYGPNGTGKTSFFDAFQWLLLGRIERLASFREGNKKQEYVINTYAAPSPARVEAELNLGGADIRLRRTGGSESNVLEWVAAQDTLRGAAAEDALRNSLVGSMGGALAAILTSSGLLQQDVMRSLLEAKASDRFVLLSQVLGLSELEQFEAAAKELHKARSQATKAARTELSEHESRTFRARSSASTLEIDLASRPTVQLAQEEVGRLAERIGWLQIEGDALASPSSVTKLLIAVRRLRDRLPQLARRHAHEVIQLQRLDVSAVASNRAELDRDMNAQQLAAEPLRRQLKDLRTQETNLLSAMRELERLANLAIPLLAERCPVCEQPIDGVNVARRLRERVGASDDLTNVLAARSRVEDQLDEIESKIGVLQGRKTQLERILHEAEAVQTRLHDADQEFSSILRDASAAGLSMRSRTLSELQSADVEPAQLHSLDAALDVLVRAHTASADGQRLAELRVEMDDLKLREADKRTEVQRLAQAEAKAKVLAEAATRSRAKVVERRFALLQPLAADIFGRLDPHPSFKGFLLRHDVSYRRGTTIPLALDEVEAKEVDPSLVFSSSQANIYALSLFLALGWAAQEKALPFVLLDDPLQSMDDVNVLGFADLCRFLRHERQLILSTHEKRFARLLERKLRLSGDEDRTLVLDFVSWDRSGPEVHQRVVEGSLTKQRILPLADAS